MEGKFDDALDGLKWKEEKGEARLILKFSFLGARFADTLPGPIGHSTGEPQLWVNEIRLAGPVGVAHSCVAGSLQAAAAAAQPLTDTPGVIVSASRCTELPTPRQCFLRPTT